MWEGIGVSSYLLINFWFTRIQANKSAIKAMVVNRVGDMFLSVAFFGVFWAFGNLDYATVYSLSPYMNETILTVIGLLFLLAAMGKSAQLGLHTWLPDRMEGYKIKHLGLFVLEAVVYYVYKNTGSTPPITEVILPILLRELSRKHLEIISANILADGYLGFSNIKRIRENNGIVNGNAQYKMTMSRASKDYLEWLYINVYKIFCGTGLYPYPNPLLPQHVGKDITQWSFGTLFHPLFTTMHRLWYEWDETSSRFVKIVPAYIATVFTWLFVAHWLMEDGYWENNDCTFLFCTECYTKKECLFLISLLSRLGVKAGLKMRNRKKDTYRIRISRHSVPLFRESVRPHIHPVFLYKLWPI